MADTISTSPTPPPHSRPLRVLAVLGVALWLAQLDWIPGPRPVGELYYFAVGLFLGAAVLLIGFPRGTTTLLRNPDLLVPFGCYQAAWIALGALPIQAATWNLNNPLSALDDGLLAVAIALTGLWLHAVFLVWQTLAIVRAVDRQPADLHGTLMSSLRLWPRGVAIAVATFVVLLAPLLVQIWMGLGLPMMLMGGTLLLWTLGWSLLTSAWLPIVLDQQRSVLEAMRHATHVSRALCRGFVLRVTAWAGALGVVTIHSFETHSFGNHHQSTSWNVAAKWLGGYPHETGWYEEVVEDAVALGWWAAPLMVVFVALAIAVKCEVVAAVRRHESEAEGAD